MITHPGDWTGLAYLGLFAIAAGLLVYFALRRDERDGDDAEPPL